MTVIITAQCKDGIVLACDSLGTQTRSVLFPELGKEYLDPSSGNPVINPQTNKPIIDANTMDEYPMVENSLSYMHKMFQIKDYPVGVLVAGISGYGNNTMEDLFWRFSDKSRIPRFVKKSTRLNLPDLRNRFFRFMRREYTKAYPLRGTDHPTSRMIWSGFYPENKRGEIWTFNVDSNDIENQTAGDPFILIAGGQYDPIQRFSEGIDERLHPVWHEQSREDIKKNADIREREVKTHLIRNLRAKGITIPTNVIRNLPPTPYSSNYSAMIPLSYDKYDYQLQHVSLQDTVSLLGFFMYIALGKHRFVTGHPTVGGNVNFASITRGKFESHSQESITLQEFKL